MYLTSAKLKMNFIAVQSSPHLKSLFPSVILIQWIKNFLRTHHVLRSDSLNQEDLKCIALNFSLQWDFLLHASMTTSPSGLSDQITGAF